MPDTLTKIEAEAFYECAMLSSISFPTSLESIGRAAFFGCFGLPQLELDSINLEEDVFRHSGVESPEPPTKRRKLG